MSEQRKTEIIAFCSGKGGTGKSLMCACFGYALLRGGQRVLMIDGDPATDGLSLFLLGPKGQDQVPSFEDQNTFIGALERFQKTGSARFEPRAIHRRGDDHRVTYSAIISGKGLYGEGVLNMPAVPDLNQGVFRAGIRHLFDQLRESGEYDYVLVDTRGGFAFESTDLCALADSFIVITEPDYTSFYQDRNLVSRVAAAARDVESPSLLRAMIVNKAVDVFPQPGKPYLETLEVLFRNQLVKEFPVRYEDTHAVPVSIEALLAYKAQKIPYRSAPESLFCMATLAAFSDILAIVTSRWTVEQVDRWNVLVDAVARAVQEKQELEERKELARTAHEEEYERMRSALADDEMKAAKIEREAAARMEIMQREYEAKVASLERELEQRSLMYEREFKRSEALLETTTFLTGSQTVYPSPPSPVTASRPTMAAAPMPAALAELPLHRPPLPAMGGAGVPREPVSAAPVSPTRRPLLVVLGIVLLAVLGVAIYLLGHRTGKNAAHGGGGGAQTAAEVAASAAAAADSGAAANAAPVVNPPEGVKARSSPGGSLIVNNYAVLLAGGKALTATGPGTPSAAYEAQLAMQAGYSVSLYQRAGRYTAAVLWDSQEQAEEALKGIQAPFDGRWASTSSVVTMSDWCPVKTALDPVVINNVSVPVWSCLTFSSSPPVPSKARGLSAKAR